MKKPIRRSLQITVICITFSTPLPILAAEDNRLQDHSFEASLPAADGGWSLFDESRVSSDRARTGTSSMFNWGFSRTVAYPPYFLGSVSGSFQELPANSGSRWQLTGYAMAPTALSGTPAFGILQVSFFDAEGNDLGTVETAGGAGPVAKISNEVNTTTLAGDWVLLDTGVATAPKGTATVQAFTLYVDYSGSNTSQGVHFDDLELRELD